MPPTMTSATVQASTAPKIQTAAAEWPSLPARDVEDLGEGLVGLEHAADPETADDQADGVVERKKAPETRPAALGEPSLEVVHRATLHGAVWVFLSVDHAKGALDELR